MARVPWNEHVYESIPTPPHARQSPPLVVDTPPPTKATMSPSTSSKWFKVALWASMLTLGFIMLLVITSYHHDYFVPALVVGSLGIYVVSVLVLHDTF